MKKLMVVLATGVLVVGCAAQDNMTNTMNNNVAKPMPKNMSHMHIGHVLTGWKDTPSNKGLLPTARAEAEIVAKHSKLAAKKLSDLTWMQMHTKHVIHAVDPGKIGKSPGLGYGVLKSAKGTGKHINLAAKSKDASDGVKNHAVHVSMTANNTVARASNVLMHADKVLQATTASEASSHVTAMNKLAQQLIHGLDANGDGKVSWHKNEGGLLVAEKHMGAMKKAEGI